MAYFSRSTSRSPPSTAPPSDPRETFWILFYGFTHLFAGVLREQVCRIHAHYARFQAVMFDPDTLVITTTTRLGSRANAQEGHRSRSCVQGRLHRLRIYVQVRPARDIRDGLQYECIGCAACIDACDQVMDKMNYPRGLIRFIRPRTR